MITRFGFFKIDLGIYAKLLIHTTSPYPASHLSVKDVASLRSLSSFAVWVVVTMFQRVFAAIRLSFIIQKNDCYAKVAKSRGVSFKVRLYLN